MVVHRQLVAVPLHLDYRTRLREGLNPLLLVLIEEP
jgi:hypothetical protein